MPSSLEISFLLRHATKPVNRMVDRFFCKKIRVVLQKKPSMPQVINQLQKTRRAQDVSEIIGNKFSVSHKECVRVRESIKAIPFFTISV